MINSNEIMNEIQNILKLVGMSKLTQQIRQSCEQYDGAHNEDDGCAFPRTS